MSITIITTEFHKEISEKMVSFAKEELENKGKKEISIIKTLGSFEVPLLAQEVLEKNSTEGIVVLGYIEKGETLHGEVMGHVVHSKLLDLGLKHKKPIGFGIIGPGATLDQAKARAESTARRAVQALLQNIEVLKEI